MEMVVVTVGAPGSLPRVDGIRFFPAGPDAVRAALSRSSGVGGLLLFDEGVEALRPAVLESVPGLRAVGVCGRVSAAALAAWIASGRFVLGEAPHGIEALRAELSRGARPSVAERVWLPRRVDDRGAALLRVVPGLGRLDRAAWAAALEVSVSQLQLLCVERLGEPPGLWLDRYVVALLRTMERLGKREEEGCRAAGYACVQNMREFFRRKGLPYPWGGKPVRIQSLRGSGEAGKQAPAGRKAGASVRPGCTK
jgi:hypothetical protein